MGNRYRICTLFVLLSCVTSPTLLIFELWVGHPDTRKRDFNDIPSPLYLILWEKYCSHPISSSPRVGEALSIVAWFVGKDALLAGEKSSWGGRDTDWHPVPGYSLVVGAVVGKGRRQILVSTVRWVGFHQCRRRQRHLGGGMAWWPATSDHELTNLLKKYGVTWGSTRANFLQGIVLDNQIEDWRSFSGWIRVI